MGSIPVEVTKQNFIAMFQEQSQAVLFTRIMEQFAADLRLRVDVITSMSDVTWKMPDCSGKVFFEDFTAARDYRDKQTVDAMCSKFLEGVKELFKYNTSPSVVFKVLTTLILLEYKWLPFGRSNNHLGYAREILLQPLNGPRYGITDDVYSFFAGYIQRNL